MRLQYNLLTPESWEHRAIYLRCGARVLDQFPLKAVADVLVVWELNARYRSQVAVEGHFLKRRTENGLI